MTQSILAVRVYLKPEHPGTKAQSPKMLFKSRMVSMVASASAGLSVCPMRRAAPSLAGARMILFHRAAAVKEDPLLPKITAG